MKRGIENQVSDDELKSILFFEYNCIIFIYICHSFTYKKVVLMKLFLTLLFSVIPLLAGSWSKITHESLGGVTAIHDCGAYVGFFAGTANGLYYVDDHTGDLSKCIDGRISSLHLSAVGNRDAYAVVSEGKNSGIYRGMNIIDGAPYIEFVKLDSLRSPQQVITVGDTLLVVSPDSIYRYSIAQNIPVKLTSIALPELAFGVESPFCAALLRDENAVLLGGYDRSPEPGVGSLCVYEAGAVARIFNANIHSLYEHVISANEKLTIIGQDTTVDKWNFLDPSKEDKISTPKNLPVEDMLILTKEYIVDGALIAATSEGVFYEEGGRWTNLGNLPVAANALYASYRGFTGAPTLFAGAEDGLYRYDETATAVSENHSRMKSSSTGVHYSQGSIKLGDTPQSGRIVLYDIRGRVVFEEGFSGVSSVKLPTHLAQGVYSLLLTRGQGIESKMITIQ